VDLGRLSGCIEWIDGENEELKLNKNLNKPRTANLGVKAGK